MLLKGSNIQLVPGTQTDECMFNPNRTRSVCAITCGDAVKGDY